MSRRLVDLELCAERVRLRPHRATDAAEGFALLDGRDEILRWLLWEGPSSPVELAEFYRRAGALEAAPELLLAVEERASGALAGSLSLRAAAGSPDWDIGYWIGVPFQRRGLGREALALAAHLAFRYFGAHSLCAWVFVGNEPSRRVLERTGFTLARTVPGRATKRGRRVDEWHFVLLASEWRRLAPAPAPVEERVVWAEPDPPGERVARA